MYVTTQGRLLLPRKIIVIGLMGVFLMLCAGCSITPSAEKIRDLEYTVVPDQEVPDVLMQLIQEKKEEGFNLTYIDGEYLYIANGYGKQKPGEYSIKMRELYLTKDDIRFQSELSKDADLNDADTGESFPFIVVKTEYIDAPVLFE